MPWSAAGVEPPMSQRSAKRRRANRRAFRRCLESAGTVFGVLPTLAEPTRSLHERVLQHGNFVVDRPGPTPPAGVWSWIPHQSFEL